MNLFETGLRNMHPLDNDFSACRLFRTEYDTKKRTLPLANGTGNKSEFAREYF